MMTLRWVRVWRTCAWVLAGACVCVVRLERARARELEAENESLAMGQPGQQSTWRYAVVVDAGSTGCRVYVYEHEASGNVVSWKGPKVTPGLAAVAHERIPLYMDPLVAFARSRVPEDERYRTWFKVLATAGMRFVGPSVARETYDAVFNALPTDFATDRGDVRTISGDDEAYYEALAVNYAYGTIDAGGRELGPPLAALDLGGASTQIAVPLKRSQRFSPQDIGIASFLGYGVERVAARYHEWLMHDADPCKSARPDAFERCGAAVSEALGVAECRRSRRLNRDGSGCALPSIAVDAELTVAATNAQSYVDGMIHDGVAVVATSLYFYAWLGARDVLRRLPDNFTADGVADAFDRDWPSPSLHTVRAAATALCSVPSDELTRIAGSPTGWHPGMGDADRRRKELPRRCFDLAYVDILLADVFGLDDSPHRIEVATVQNDVELDWTLGVVLDDALRSTRRHKRSPPRAHHLLDHWRPLLLLVAGLLVLLLALPSSKRRRKAVKKLDDGCRARLEAVHETASDDTHRAVSPPPVNMHDTRPRAVSSWPRLAAAS